MVRKLAFMEEDTCKYKLIGQLHYLVFYIYMRGSEIEPQTSSKASTMAKGISSWGFVFMLVLGCLCMVANGVTSRRVGGIEDVPNFQQNQEIQDLAKYAVNEHNKDQNTALSLSKVVKAQQQVVAGMKYYLTLEAFNDGKPKLYRAVIYVKPWQNYKELEEFTPLKE